MKLLITLSLLFLVAACSTNKNSPNGEASKQIGEAVITPLKDLNLVKTKIPGPLQFAQKNPYAKPINESCYSLAQEINSLNEVLGADLDTPVTKDDQSLIARSLVSESVSTIRKTTESAVPFRNWVRKLSGAEQKSRAVNSAIAAGTIRRAYLKGYGQANNCRYPAAPEELITQIHRVEPK
jgi:hypothetical protein